MWTEPVRIRPVIDEERPMTHPTTRILALLELLQASRRMGGAELAARLGVDPRTLRRYVLRLQDLGIPVEAERGRYGGYRLLPGYKLPPLMLTEDEATAVVLGLLAGRRLGMATAATAADSALAKIQRVLPAAVRDRVGAVEATLGLTLTPRAAPTPATATVLTLAEAARQGRRVRIRYRSWRGEETERDLDPYGLVLHAGRWYVTGHDHRRGQVRTFRLDRVLAAEPGAEAFVAPAGFDPVDQVMRSLARVPYTHAVEVVLDTSMAEARRRIPPEVGTLSDAGDAAGGGVLLRAQAERLDGMARLLAGLGWPFVIREPAVLRTAVRDLAGRLAAQADRVP
jgi:predicted DNA-binding transcriptional regulator YafY